LEGKARSRRKERVGGLREHLLQHHLIRRNPLNGNAQEKANIGDRHMTQLDEFRDKGEVG